MKKIQILKATNKNLEEIISLINIHYQKYGDFVNLHFYDRDLKDIEKNYFKKNGYFWIAKYEKSIIGTIALLSKNIKIAEIKRVYVKENFHGKNIGNILMQKVLQFAINNKYEKLFLWSDVRYKRAHNFFLKNNFKVIKEANFDNADKPYRALLFEKILNL